MPLDRVNGEHFGGLRASGHIVVNARDVAALTGYTTEYTRQGKFISANQKKPTRSVFDDAVANAIDAFADKGALRPIRFDEDDVVAQVYPCDMKLAIAFQRRIAGAVYYSTSYYDLPKPVLDALLANRGKAVSKH